MGNKDRTRRPRDNASRANTLKFSMFDRYESGGRKKGSRAVAKHFSIIPICTVRGCSPVDYKIEGASVAAPEEHVSRSDLRKMKSSPSLESTVLRTSLSIRLF